MSVSLRNASSRIIEVGCWAVGVILIALYFAARVGGELERAHGIALFAEARAATRLAADEIVLDPDATVSGRPLPASPETPREASPASTRAQGFELLPVALLRIPGVGLEVPVYADTSERNLNRGAGWVEGTAAPGEIGNIAIAAHRDGHFRPLKDVAVGDVLELESLLKKRSYRVVELSIVDPRDISPLGATENAVVTLVTCYPFYFVGNAPQRYIVRALAID